MFQNNYIVGQRIKTHTKKTRNLHKNAETLLSTGVEFEDQSDKMQMSKNSRTSISVDEVRESFKKLVLFLFLFSSLFFGNDVCIKTENSWIKVNIKRSLRNLRYIV